MEAQKTSLILLFVSFVAIVSAEIRPGSNPPRIFKIRSNRNIQNHHILLQENSDEKLNLRCRVESKDDEQFIQWFKNGEIISENEGIRLSDQHRIEFVGPDLQLHQGYYHCEVKNSIGHAKSEIIHLSPIAPEIKAGIKLPKFKKNGKPEVEIQEIGKTVRFHCKASGNPSPNIAWTHNGKKLPEFNDKETLIIENVGTDNVGTYACNVSNSAGYKFKEVYLNILTQRPFFVETPQKEQTVSVGQRDFHLRCKAKAYPPASIQWFFEGMEIPYIDDKEYEYEVENDYSISDNGDLVINQITSEMKGTFECLASNSEGSRSATASLTVINSTTIIDGPTDVEANVSETINLPCSVLWDPSSNLEVIWRKDNINIDIDNERIQIHESNKSLSINNLNHGDKGVYTCVASTGTSTDTDSGTLMVLGDEIITPVPHTGLRANWLLIITIFIICLLLLIIITSTICFKKHHAQKKLADSQEQIVIEKGKKQPEFERMISKSSYGKVSMHPIFDEYGSPNPSSFGSGSFVDPEEKALENLIGETSGDQVDEMKWDHEISFRFEPGNLSMFGQNFNFEHDKSNPSVRN
jgi:cell division protein FtsL